MPGLVAFGRRWSVGSDDLFLPSICLGLIQFVCLTTSVVGFVVDFDELMDPNFENCGNFLFTKMVSTIILLSISLILTIFLMVVSLRGSILDDGPRKSAQYLIYILLVVLLSMVTWSGFAVAWVHRFYTSCTVQPTKQILLALVVSTWFVLVSVIITGWCTYDGAGRSWVKMKRYQANLKEFEQKYPAIYKRSGSRHNRNWRQRKVIRAYQDSWNHRCHLLFCCIHRTERNRDSFADLARLLSEFFRDLDVVPSDVVVALLLLRRLQRLEQCSIVKQKRNNTYEFLSGVPITSKTKFVAMNDPKDLEVFRNVVHFMHYASAAYGWPWYLLPNGCRGICKLCSNLRCCCSRAELEGVVLEDNCCHCNYAVIPSIFDPGTCDVVYATYHVEVGETPFFVVVDYTKKSIVVSIRGTLSLKDVITDLNAEGETLPVEPRKEDWMAHKGILAAAVYMKSKLLEGGILEKALNYSIERGTQNYRLVLVGHSLGAGTAAILAVLLREEYPSLQCYAFSPPGGLLSMPVVEYTKDFVTTVIVGKDLVPRIGLSQMEALRTDLINAMKKSNKPKWQTLMSGMICCCCMKPEFAMPQRLSSAPSIQSEEFLRSRRSLKDLREVTLNPNESALSLTVHQPLYPPGRIMHIVRHHPRKDEIKYESLWRRVLKKDPVFQALWTENTDYGQVLISPGMIDDHMPHQVLRALHRVVTSHGPAKPQRHLIVNASPLILSKESLVIDEIVSNPTCRFTVKPKSHSPQRVCMETSFANVSSDPKNSPGGSGDCTLMNPSPLIADADTEADVIDDEDLTPTNPEGLHNILSSLNLSWDYVTRLQDKYLERESLHQHLYDQTLPPRLPFPYSHERRSSIGNTSSSCCSDDAGSTFKEIFGPAKYEDWMAPLASPETLSEISSLSSRASFFLPKDQSPLLRLKGNGRHCNSSSLHRHHAGSVKNGKSCGTNVIGMHNRSFSCTYPENGKEVSIIGSVLCEGTNGKLNGRYGVHEPEEVNLSHIELVYRCFDEEMPQLNLSTNPPIELETFNHQKKVITPLSSEEPEISNPHHRKTNGEATTKRVSFNLKRKFASKDSGCSIGDNGSYPTTPAGRPTVYEPTYPIFSHQEEYGVPILNSPHYTYCGQSPVDSPDIVFAPPQCRHPSHLHGHLQGNNHQAETSTGSLHQCAGSDLFRYPEFAQMSQSEEFTTYLKETHH